MSGQQPDNGAASPQPVADELAFPDLKPGDAWGESITRGRAAVLDKILQGWEAEKEHGNRKGPFSSFSPGVPSVVLNVLTGADVFWLTRKLMLGVLAQQQVTFLPLQGANLAEADLRHANLAGAQLQGADLRGAHLEGADLRGAHLEGADLRLAFLDNGTALNDVSLGDRNLGYVFLADVRWGEVNLAVVDWTRTSAGILSLRQRIDAIQLGDETYARQTKFDNVYASMARRWWLAGYIDAVRANRQLATALRSQGLNEDADRFAYKAQKLQRQVLRRQRRYGAAFGSWLLDVVAGYGYKPIRTLTAYLLAIIAFAIAYFALGQTVGPHLSPLGAFVFSMTSFHGRGFFPGGIVLDDSITVLAAFEAFIGLIIEVSFIATFTQRFFAR